MTTSYQRQLTHGAWDENQTIGGAVDENGNLVNGPVRSLGQKNVDRFGPEFKQYYTKTLDFHLDGDVGIGDLVYASTYWAQDDRWVNEYSEYMQYVNTGPPDNLTAASQQAYTCLTDPYLRRRALTAAARCPSNTTTTGTTSIVGRMSCGCNPRTGGRIHWLGGVYWEKTRELIGDYFHMPGLQTAGAGLAGRDRLLLQFGSGAAEAG